MKVSRAARAGAPILNLKSENPKFHLIESVVYGVGPRDPRVFIATTVLLLGVGLLACWIPARRASRLSPVDALRQE